VRGTFKETEVKRRSGVQARRRVGSLKLLQDLHNRQKLSDPPPPRFFCYLPRELHSNGVSFCETYLS
jgi:hypothetical protein